MDETAAHAQQLLSARPSFRPPTNVGSTAGSYIAMGGQIVDASLVAAPKQRNTDDEKDAIKQGHIPEKWKAATVDNFAGVSFYKENLQR